MKKIFAVAIVAMMAMTANAQWYVGGGVGYQHNKTEGVKSNTFKIIPEVGYNINEAWAVGLGVGYGYNKTGDVKTNTFEIAPYLRGTFLKFEKVNVFCDLGVNYAYAKIGDAKSDGFGIGIYPGLAVNLNDKISFVTKIGALSYAHAKVKEGPKTDEFNIGVDGSDLSFGVYYNF